MRRKSWDITIREMSRPIRRQTAMRLSSNRIVTPSQSVALLIQRTPSTEWGHCFGQLWLERRGRDDAALVDALLYAVERNELGNQLPDFGGRLRHNRKAAPQFSPYRGSTRFDDGCN